VANSDTKWGDRIVCVRLDEEHVSYFLFWVFMMKHLGCSAISSDGLSPIFQQICRCDTIPIPSAAMNFV
jgi:hypothetical protein